MHQAGTLRQQHANRASTRPRSAQSWGALIGGGALALYGLTRRSTTGLLLAAGGGTLAYYGVRANGAPHEAVARGSVLVNTSPQEAFRFWRNFENLSRFMRHLDRVEVISETQSRWVAIGPMGSRVAWNAEIANERENELIAWRSLPGSDLTVDGVVEFKPAPVDRGTIISCAIRYQPPAGQLGITAAKVLGKDPSFLMQQDLRRFKALIETGEIPTIEGQSHGPRSIVAAAARVASPDYAWQRRGSIREAMANERRAS
ncbi:MAG TPA: SRPBCC family protein [Candidatus Acidoferrales bacterium]|nr:SRPBCC family protein [Candidatus Acidoferrales bacterium]